MFNLSTLLPYDALLKCVVTEVVLFSIVAFNKFENQSIFDEIKAYKTKGVSFLDHPVKEIAIRSLLNTIH